ncbi:hypothetical protein V6N11_013842 [Hibiscus sabdariffa]|uniref:Uncharacterized protein n=2 Tax=Hibiscus sabdariffa TaxID=183260 RepID=A0ABR2NA10_9ROSI
MASQRHVKSPLPLKPTPRLQVHYSVPSFCRSSWWCLLLTLLSISSLEAFSAISGLFFPLNQGGFKVRHHLLHQPHRASQSSSLCLVNIGPYQHLC